jgi:nucleoside phosphorylase
MLIILYAGSSSLLDQLQKHNVSVHRSEDIPDGYVVVSDDRGRVFCEIPSTKTALAVRVTRIIEKYRPTALLLCGSAGALCGSAECIGMVAAATDTLQYDTDFTDLGYPPATAPYSGRSVFASERGLTQALLNAAEELQLSAKSGRFISADRFLACDMVRKELRVDYLADFTDTESGAVGEIAALYNLPFAVIKGVANLADHSGEVDYLANKNAAANKALEVCINISGDWRIA